MLTVSKISDVLGDYNLQYCEESPCQWKLSVKLRPGVYRQLHRQSGSHTRKVMGSSGARDNNYSSSNYLLQIYCFT